MPARDTSTVQEAIVFFAWLASELRKVCACGKFYRRPAWDQLELVGYLDVDGIRLELRNCVCGSTLCVERP